MHVLRKVPISNLCLLNIAFSDIDMDSKVIFPDRGTNRCKLERVIILLYFVQHTSELVS
jgi:hypothetical protein